MFRLQTASKGIEAFELIEDLEPELVFLPMPGLDESVARARRPSVRANNRSLIVGVQGLVYAAMDEGTILMVTSQFEAQSNYRTIEELQSNLGPIFSAGSSFFSGQHYKINEVIRWFESSFQLKMDDKKQTEIPVSRIQTRRLRTLLKIGNTPRF
jgi:two-component system LytT family response regulator/two-component system response regulator LytT